MSHFGEFSQDLVNSLSEGLEYIMRSNNAPKILTKRMFSIMIEGLQNIRLHGARNHENKQLGHVMIMESNDEYTVSIGNVVDIKSKVVLTNHLNMINNMSHQEVKDYYISVLTNGVTTEKGGDRKSTRLNSSHVRISYAVFCLKKKKKKKKNNK